MSRVQALVAPCGSRQTSGPDAALRQAPTTRSLQLQALQAELAAAEATVAELKRLIGEIEAAEGPTNSPTCCPSEEGLG